MYKRQAETLAGDIAASNTRQEQQLASIDSDYASAEKMASELAPVSYTHLLSILTEILAELEQKFDVRLCDLEVSGGAGSIPDGGRAVIAVPELSLIHICIM